MHLIGVLSVGRPPAHPQGCPDDIELIINIRYDLILYMIK